MYKLIPLPHKFDAYVESAIMFIPIVEILRFMLLRSVSGCFVIDSFTDSQIYGSNSDLLT